MILNFSGLRGFPRAARLPQSVPLWDLIDLRRQMRLVTRLAVAWALAVGVLGPAADAANTFINTDSLTTARQFHTATLLQNGKVLVAGGLTNASVAVASVELYDPAAAVWAPTGNLGTPRVYHTGTLLLNGKVLVAGGITTGGATLASAELYDPATGNWTPTGTLGTNRAHATATLLTNGKVLVVGGQTTGGARLASAELYDPATSAWSVTGALPVPLDGHTATLLPNGQVLVAGGNNGTSFLNSAELFNPATGTWSVTNQLATARQNHTATLLPNGLVLVAGGANTINLTSAELYNPATGTWSPAHNLGTARQSHTATLEANGRLLVAGGFNGTYVAGAELYDIPSDTWLVSGPLLTGRTHHTATLLPSGQVLVAGGQTTGSVVLASAELDNPAGAGSWNQTGAPPASRQYHTATLLPNGKVLLAAGGDSQGVLNTATLYDPATGGWSDTGTLHDARQRHSATLLPNGKVLVAGGDSGTIGATLATAELYDPATGVWGHTGPMVSPQELHTATLLPNGKVLVMGGLGGGPELYDPVTGTWNLTPPPIVTPGGTVMLLRNGKVIVAAGGIAELFDPATGTWSLTGAFVKPRTQNTATLLPNGQVLVAGGAGPLASAELYNPATGTWSLTGSMATPRANATAILQGNGTVLVVGGEMPFSTYFNTTEIYDPATGTWSAGGDLLAFHSEQTSTLLANGQVLVAGGSATAGPFFDPTNTAEFYNPQPGIYAAGQPHITSAAFTAGGRLVLTGTGFRGLSSASGGNAGQDSPTSYPMVQLRQLGNDQSVFLLPEPANGFSDTTFTSAPVAPPPAGYALATVFANGIPSAGAVVSPLMNINVMLQPAGPDLGDGATLSMAATLRTPASQLFLVENTGAGLNLTGLTITKTGVNAGDFTVSANPTAPLAPGASSTFSIRFAPTTTGAKTAAVHIANNVPGKNPYDINLTGQVLSYTTDTDGDGMSDAAEFDLAALGFNWQVSQTNLVTTYYSNANVAGLYFQTQYSSNYLAGISSVTNSPNSYNLYALSQVEALNVGTPLLQKNPTNGLFKLTIGVMKATNLSLPFVDFPMNGPGCSTLIDSLGKLEFQFTAPDNAAFFRLLSN